MDQLWEHTNIALHPCGIVTNSNGNISKLHVYIIFPNVKWYPICMFQEDKFASGTRVKTRVCTNEYAISLLGDGAKTYVMLLKEHLPVLD